MLGTDETTEQFLPRFPLGARVEDCLVSLVHPSHDLRYHGFTAGRSQHPTCSGVLASLLILSVSSDTRCAIIDWVTCCFGKSSVLVRNEAMSVGTSGRGHFPKRKESALLTSQVQTIKLVLTSYPKGASPARSLVKFCLYTHGRPSFLPFYPSLPQ